MPVETSKVDTAPAYTGEAPQVITTGQEPLTAPRLGIWELAWPAIVNNLLHSLVGLVGIKMVGSIGAGAVAAVTTGNRVFFILQALLMAVTAGTTALVARARGSGDRDEAERVNRASMWVCLGISLVITLPAVVFARTLGRPAYDAYPRFRIENRNLHDTSFSNMASGNVYSWGKGRNINFDHHRGAAFQNLSSRVHVGHPNRQWASSHTKTGHYTAANETYWNIRPRAETRRLDTWPAQNIIGRVRASERTAPDWFDLWAEHLEELEPEDLHLAQWHRRTGIPMPKRPRFPRALPEGLVTNTSVGRGMPPTDLVPK